ncbi:flavin-containing monooxygenase, partial [Nocardia asiatica]|uniref:flavin-containing monooxygenase n=1 Tax=Nocardia asiatica TaxID=209252 RepID=UPI0005C18548
RDVSHRQGLRSHLRFDTSITAASFSDQTGRWTLITDTGEQYHANSVVWAVGQLHRPHLPHYPGQEAFGGRMFHTAEWHHSVDLTGDIAVIGTGSSAAQVVPHLARAARHLEVWQRTASWILPKPASKFGPITQLALSRAPALHQLYRQALYHGADRILTPIMTGGWSARPAQWAAAAHLRRHVPDPELRARLTPDYRIGEKRILFDNGFYPALTRKNVDLVTDAIAEITPTGIRATDGTYHRADVIVWATGFRASEFLAPVEIRGRDGALLSHQWSEGASAFLGLAVPGFPSMWILAGPNSFTPAGSNPVMKGFQTRYITSAIQWRNQIGTAIEVSAHAMDTYTRWLESAMAKTIWPAGVHSWFKTASGKVTNPWPASIAMFDRMTRSDPKVAFQPVLPAAARSDVA